jgi:hypothetical protein
MIKSDLTYILDLLDDIHLSLMHPTSDPMQVGFTPTIKEKLERYKRTCTNAEEDIRLVMAYVKSLLENSYDRGELS